MSSRSILVVDNDTVIREYLATFLAARGHAVECLGSGDEAIERLASGFSPLMILLDIVPPDKDGIEVLSNFKSIDPSIPIITLSRIGQIKTVVEAMKIGASGYLTKPFEEEALELEIDNVLEKQRLKEEVKTLKQQLAYIEQGNILTSNPQMLRIIDIARHVAGTDVPVLILGESGVGKEVVASFIHEQSNRSDGPFVKVNCAALPHELLEAELFGYERGAVTSAIRDKTGKFEQADKGTMLLDEIGELSPYLQTRLLQVLQDSEISRLGSKRPVKINVRVLATTNKKLKEAVLKGEFRNDLYFRLNVIKFELPPLRERREDIPLLCNHFLEKYRDRYQSPVRQIPKELMELFLRYDWPGNVRQLENVVKRYLILPDADIISELKTANTEAVAVIPTRTVSLKEVSGHAAEVAEKEVVLRVLEDTGWNRKEAARRLMISYKALRNKLKKWQLVRQRPEVVRALGKSA
ncbi:MAG: sigma-54-dependent Fis family transcriptional regulator [Acidobacteria bacterium]|nr:MAG: sigma-54-dependent Fis family transcriptional regulator [Acidobacteriota bacterium]